jgi:cellulase/cellobiase CelA1
LRSIGVGSFLTLLRFGGKAPVAEAAKGIESFSSSSAAWRKETPSALITQSITVPPAWHAPRQCQRFFAGVTTSDGVLSSWKQQRPIRSAP